jgi:hypothetical protein
MSENKNNLLYFQNPSMQGLYNEMQEWQRANKRRLLSTSIQKDGDNYCCIALSNPTEVVIVSQDGQRFAEVHLDPVSGVVGGLRTYNFPP